MYATEVVFSITLIEPVALDQEASVAWADGIKTVELKINIKAEIDIL